MNTLFSKVLVSWLAFFVPSACAAYEFCFRSSSLKSSEDSEELSEESDSDSESSDDGADDLWGVGKPEERTLNNLEATVCSRSFSGFFEFFMFLCFSGTSGCLGLCCESN